jgi:hypothetical protein
MAGPEGEPEGTLHRARVRAEATDWQRPAPSQAGIAHPPQSPALGNRVVQRVLDAGLQAAPLAHSTARPLRQAAVLQLQRTHGNAYVQRLVAQLHGTSHPQAVQTQVQTQPEQAPQARSVEPDPVATQTPVAAGSLKEIEQHARSAAADPGVTVALAGSPVAQPAAGGLAFINRQSSRPRLIGGLTQIKHSGAFTAPSFNTTTSVERDGYQRRHFAEVQPTTATDATHDCYYAAPGLHERPLPSGGNTARVQGRTYRYYIQISDEMSALLRAGEQEHLDDAQRAYDLTYGLIAHCINTLVGRRFGPASNPQAAQQLALAELARRLPAQLGTDPINWVRMLDALLSMSHRVRDEGHLHDVTTISETIRGNRIIHELAPSGTTQIGLPADQVVNYPTGGNAATPRPQESGGSTAPTPSPQGTHREPPRP